MLREGEKRSLPRMRKKPKTRRELAHRSNDGLDVTLLWQPADDELTLCVCDERLGAYFEIHPAPFVALDAFHHPHAYADFASVYYEDERLAA
jgi:hypothetical protein